MTATDPWIEHHATELAICTPWPATRWAEALTLIVNRGDRDEWVHYVYDLAGQGPDRLPAILAAYTACTNPATATDLRAIAASPVTPDIIADLEALATNYRRHNGMPPDAELHIDLGPEAAGCIADIIAADAAAWLDTL